MKRAKHNLSHYRVTAADMGLLYPVSAVEVLPGDTFRQSTSALVRMQPLMAPLMHPVYVSIAHWFVPNRIIWSGWEDFITGKAAVDLIPTKTAPTDPFDIQDYMGVAPGSENTNLLPVRAYNKIWNEFYRDQDIIEERGENEETVARIAWQKDRFTTARAQPQKGDTAAASIYLAQDVPVVGLGVDDGNFPLPNISVRESDGQERTYDQAKSTTQDAWYVEENGNTGFPHIRIREGTVGGQVDINEWRRAMALQRYREHRNKFGSRYKDYLAFLGVNTPDGRLRS